MIVAYRQTPWGIAWIGNGPLFWLSSSRLLAKHFADTPNTRYLLTKQGFEIESA